MERTVWLQEWRRLVEERYDRLFAKDYDAQWGEIGETHRRFLEQFLALCPAGGTILDAACGTGKYWSLILASGRQVVGLDLSRQMLARAQAKFPAVPVQQGSLQDMAYTDAFDGILCVDAMELVCPEDWLPVLRNCYRALRAGGYLYLTVEMVADEEVQAAYRAGQAMGLPVVMGEWAHEGGYHYYPAIEQVRAWVQEAGFTIVAEGTGDGYEHFLMWKVA